MAVEGRIFNTHAAADGRRDDVKAREVVYHMIWKLASRNSAGIGKEGIYVTDMAVLLTSRVL